MNPYTGHPRKRSELSSRPRWFIGVLAFIRSAIGRRDGLPELELPVRQTQPARELQMDAWVQRLKAAYDAGYYKTESAPPGEQTLIPWAGVTCRDCPFWFNGACWVLRERRSGDSHTCPYFDTGNRPAAWERMREWQDQRWRSERERFNRQDQPD